MQSTLNGNSLYQKLLILSQICVEVIYMYPFYRATACNATHGISRPFSPSVCQIRALWKKRQISVPALLYHMK